MRQIVSAFGALLIACGVAVLGYVGYSYIHPSNSGSVGWSDAQKHKGQQIAQQLSTPQIVAVPKRLGQRTGASPGTEPAVSMLIPKIGVDAPVVQTAPINGVWTVADWAVGHLTTTPDPGAAGNAAYSAHDDIKGEIFKRIDQLHPGDRVMLRTRHMMYTYVVTGQLTVDPSDVSVLNPTRQSTVTLISCTPYWVDTQRLIVQAVLQSARPV